jgi:predicted transcriptional regulator
MAKAREFEFEKPVPLDNDEDEATLAAIDEGIRDAKSGRTVSIADLRKLLPKWITSSSSRKDR